MVRWLSLLLLLCMTTPLPAQGKAKKKAAVEPKVEMPDDEADDENIPRVVPVFDPGSHTRLIQALAFTPDKQRLITVGEDSSIQIWSATTGERLEILRLPSYGHEQGFTSSGWVAAAISPDGKYVAVGGAQKKGLSTERERARARLLIVDLVHRTVHPVAGFRRGVTSLAFAPDRRLAVASAGDRTEKQITIFPASAVEQKGRRATDTVVLPVSDVRNNIELLQFSPDGNRLCASTARETFTWDLSAETPLPASLPARGMISAVAWSPDSQHLLRAWWVYSDEPHGIESCTPGGEQEWEHPFSGDDVFDANCMVRSIDFTGPATALLTTNIRAGDGAGGLTPILFDLKARTGRRLFKEPEATRFQLLGAATHDSELAAMTTSAGLDAVIYRVKDGALVARCGAASPVPTVVGWSKPGKSPTIAWSETRKPGRGNTVADDLEVAFDLQQIQMADVRSSADFEVFRTTLQDWKLSRTSIRSLSLTNAGMQTGEVQGGNGITAMTLIPRENASPWFAWGYRQEAQSHTTAVLSRDDGSTVKQLKPAGMFIRDMVPSPDGRLLLVSTGTHRLCIYTMEGDEFPLISVARVNGEWVAWSGAGYYAASPGGEKLFGWAESHGPTALATFHPAEKFARHFRRPDLLARAIQLGSIQAATAQVEVRAAAIEEILPPNCSLEKLKQVGSRVQVRAVAKADANGKPVVSMRLLLDGRPVTGGAQRTIASGEPAEATWEVDVPVGNHELKLLARNEDSSAVSEPLVVTGPKSISQQPVLHRLCIGINEYQNSTFNLNAAAKDAADVYAALERHCVGPQNRFGTAKGILLTNRQATRATVLKAIGDIRKAAKPGDLVVLLFAGHGIKQQDEFYLMTHEADPNASLKGNALSGEDLRQSLSEMECPVLLMMDACHSARGVKAFRPATDDLTRSLTDDTAGVTVLAAAMAHEVASATEENGHFTAAFLKALQLGQGVPFDPHDHVLYTHHIYSVVFSEVRKATNGKQNPFLNMPWTAPPLALRDVPTN